MNKQKILKLALLALLLSALTFAAMPGSVHFYGESVPEKLLSFFNLEDLPAAGYLTLAAYVTVVTSVLAAVAAFSEKYQPFRGISWCCLAAAALTAAPYMTAQKETLLQPNVIITVLLMICWVIAMYLDKQKKQNTERKTVENRLS